MAQVRIISKSKVHLPSGELLPPGSTIPLSFFDARFVDFPRNDFVLLYPDAPASPSSLRSLKSSLACTLPNFHPFGGDLAYLPSSRDVDISCSEDSGVIVVEAESDLDICRLSNINVLDLESLKLLVPNMDAFELPVPCLGVQFTLFSNGGVSVGISMHHACTDGSGMWQFIDCWTKTCHDGEVPAKLRPVHDRAVIAHPNKEELKKQVLKLYAPIIPKLNAVCNKPIEDPIQCITRTFNVDLSSIQLLKRQIVQSNNAPPLTTFHVLAAHFWISMAHAHDLTAEDNTPSLLHIPMNCRTLLNPAVPTAYTGNCVRKFLVESQGTSLMARDGLSKACMSIGKALFIARKQPLKEVGDISMYKWLGSFNGLKVFIGGSPKMQVYDADFGWGKPSLHAMVSLVDGLGIMTAGKYEGTIHLQVMLKEGPMEKFAHAFGKFPLAFGKL